MLIAAASPSASATTTASPASARSADRSTSRFIRPAAQPTRHSVSAYSPRTALPGGAMSSASPAAKPVIIPRTGVPVIASDGHQDEHQVGDAAAGQVQPVQHDELKHERNRERPDGQERLAHVSRPRWWLG